MRRLTHLLVLAAFVFSCGGQWYLLQCVAWANMIREYSQVVPFSQAVQMTFSGEYPCPICKAIAEKKQSENNKVCAIEKYEKKFFPPVAALAVVPLSSTLHYPVFADRFQSRAEAPPTPPPRPLLS